MYFILYNYCKLLLYPSLNERDLIEIAEYLLVKSSRWENSLVTFHFAVIRLWQQSSCNHPTLLPPLTSPQKTDSALHILMYISLHRHLFFGVAAVLLQVRERESAGSEPGRGSAWGGACLYVCFGQESGRPFPWLPVLAFPRCHISFRSVWCPQLPVACSQFRLPYKSVRYLHL